jgi:hypothetical protein
MRFRLGTFPLAMATYARGNAGELINVWVGAARPGTLAER